jgi:Fe-S-cluster containining protein
VTEEGILHAICSDLPSIECEAGCIDCCTVALWSPIEWESLPIEKRSHLNLGLAKVKMTTPGNVIRLAGLPVLANDMMSMAGKPRLAVTRITEDEGLILTSFGLEGKTCVFRDSEKGCTVYDHRPFICRIMGSNSASVCGLACPKGIKPDKELPDYSINKRFAMWATLFPAVTTPKEVKN